MKIAVDVSPLSKGHKLRGIGSYTKNLVDEYKRGKQGIDFEFFENPDTPPPVDLIHYPYFDLFFHTLPINKKASRVVVTIHDVIPLIFPEHFPRGVRGNINLILQKLALKNVDAIICDSKTSKKDIIEKLSVPEDKIHVVYLAPAANFKKISDQKRLLTVSKRHNLPKNFALYVGDVNWSKNIPNLLKAISKSDVSLVMVGNALVDESLTEVRQINKLIERLLIKNRVVRTGYVHENDLVAVYNLASVTVVPSYYEGFGLPVLESMACGTQVVCSNVASLSEIGKGSAAFCDPNDPEDIANKTKIVLNLSHEDKSKLEKIVIKHASKFTWAKTARETASIYKLL